MKVSTGGFGNAVTEVVEQPDKSSVFRAANQAIDEVVQVHEGLKRNREALQRAKAANASANYQLEVEQTAQAVQEDMAAGTVNYETAQEEFDARVKKLEVPTVELDNPIDRENHAQVYSMVRDKNRLGLAPSIFAARQRDGVAQLDQFLDTQAKRAIEPGANVDAINASADAFGANARVYGLPADVIARRVQEFKDSNYFNHGVQRAVEADEDLPALHSLLTDITSPDGFYAKRLDPTKRNALQASVQSKIDRIEMRGQAISDRREARGERAIAQIERQISSTVPATPEMWADWANTVEGTTSKAAFTDLVQTENEIQQVLRAPVPDQVRLVQERQAELFKNGGTVAQAANVDRLSRAVDSNVKLLTNEPVVFAEKRLGDKNEPIDVATIMVPETMPQNSAILQERAARIHALSTQFGTPVPMRPLLPQEAKQIAATMNAGTPTQVAELFNSLRGAAGSSDVYRGIMQQIAPDAPVKGIAGMIAGMQRELVTNTHWFKGDDTVASRDVAATLLEGERLLNRSSTMKAEDGKAQTKLVLPETKVLQDKFASAVGTAFAGRPQAAEVAFQAVQAYYAGRSAQTGKIAKDSSDVDTALVREAVTNTLGNVVDYNGAGEVLAPWGMAEDDFNDRVARKFKSEAQARGLPANVSPDMSFFGLSNGGSEGEYAVTVGRQLLLDKAGNPFIINIRAPDPRDQHGTIKR